MTPSHTADPSVLTPDERRVLVAWRRAGTGRGVQSRIHLATGLSRGQVQIYCQQLAACGLIPETETPAPKEPDPDERTRRWVELRTAVIRRRKQRAGERPAPLSRAWTVPLFRLAR